MQLNATQIANATYAWLPMNNISDFTIYNPLAFPITSGYYIAKLSTIHGCNIKDSRYTIVFKYNILTGAPPPKDENSLGEGNAEHIALGN